MSQLLLKSIQDLVGVFIWGRVFERNPELRLVCVEADAGWAPHFAYRMDHGYKRHRFWMKAADMQKLPSEYFKENVYLTFQDDWVAFRMTDMVNPRRLMWANDFPHSDSTWPHPDPASERAGESLDPARQRGGAVWDWGSGRVIIIGILPEAHCRHRS